MSVYKNIVSGFGFRVSLILLFFPLLFHTQTSFAGSTNGNLIEAPIPLASNSNFGGRSDGDFGEVALGTAGVGKGWTIKNKSGVILRILSVNGIGVLPFQQAPNTGLRICVRGMILGRLGGANGLWGGQSEYPFNPDSLLGRYHYHRLHPFSLLELNYLPMRYPYEWAHRYLIRRLRKI